MNLAYIAGATGLVALAVGSYFGLDARSKWNESEPHCPGDHCDDVGYGLSEDAQTSARIASVAFGVGLVGIGAATYLVLTSPRRDPLPGKGARGNRIRPGTGPGFGFTLATQW